MSRYINSRLFLTVLAVLFLVLLSLTIPIIRDAQPFTSNSLFYFAVFITSLDRIKFKHKGMTLLLNLIHSPLPIIISIWFSALLYTNSILSVYYIELGILLNSILTILLLNLSLRFTNLKLAFLMIILVAIGTPMLSKILFSAFPLLNINSESIEALSLSWQILMGIVLAIGLRTSFKPEILS